MNSTQRVAAQTSLPLATLTAEEIVDIAEALKAIGVTRDPKATIERFVASGARAYPALLSALCKEAAPHCAEKALGWLDTFFGPDAHIELTALAPDGNGRPSCFGRLGVASERAGLHRFICENFGQSNLYVGVNPRTPNAAKQGRAAQADGIAAHHAFVVDFDPPKGLATDKWGDWRDGIVKKLDTCKPLALVATGRGVQGWFKAVPTTDREEMNTRAKGWGATLKSIASDAVGDLPRIMRLPYTVNIPTMNKRQAGARIALARPCPGASDTTARTLAPLDDALRLAFAVKSGAAPALPSTPLKPQPAASGPVKASADFARRVLLSLPNTGTEFQARAHWISVCQMLRDATDAEPTVAGQRGAADPKARAAWIEWSERFPGATPGEAERVFDTLGPTSGTAEGISGLLRKLKICDGGAHAAVAAPLAFELFDTQGAADPQDAAHKLLHGGDAGDHGRPRAGERFVRIWETAGADFFMSNEGEFYVRVEGKTLPLDDTAAVAGYFADRGEFAVDSHIKAAVSHAKGLAHRNRREVACRAHADAAKRIAYLDLARPDGKIVVIEPGKWRIADAAACPVPFVPVAQARPLPLPASDGKTASFLDRIAQHINILPVQQVAPDDDGIRARAVIAAVLGRAAFPLGAAPLVVMTGPAGAGKTSAARRLKAVIDPNSAGEVARVDEAGFAGRFQMLLILDNLSKITPGESDALARLATGHGAAARRLYSQSQMAVAGVVRCSLIVTSVNDSIVRQADLASRALLLPLAPLARRRTERDLAADWERDHPAMLAAFLDALADALGRLDAVGLLADRLGRERLADTAEIAEALMQAAGYPAGTGLETLRAMGAERDTDLLAGDAVARIAAELAMSSQSGWRGTATEAYTALGQRGLGAAPGAPRSAAALGAHLARIEPALRSGLGLEVKRSRGTGRDRTKVIEITAGDPTAAGDFLARARNGHAPELTPLP